MRPFSLRWLIPFALVVLLLPACSDDAGDSPGTTLVRTTMASETTTTTTDAPPRSDHAPLIIPAPTTTEAVTTTSAAAPSTTAAPATTTSTTTAGPTKLLANGDFETGDLAEWTDVPYTAGRFGGWFVYEDGTTPPTDDARDDHNVFEVSDPPQGRYAAVTDGNSASRYILYRDFTVSGPSVLHVTVFYRNTFSPGYGYGETRIIAPDSLLFGVASQQFRVDVIDPEALITSVADEDVLATVFRTVEGDPITLEPTEVTFDLSPWDDQTIRLRFAAITNRGPFFAGVDDVRIEPSD